MLAVVVSSADEASERVGDALLDLADWEAVTDESRPDAEGGGTTYRLADAELRTVDALHLETEGVASAFDDPDCLVFASRHAGETGKLLTAHHTGNFGAAEHGGDGRALARACPNAHRRVYRALREHAPEGYEVGMECTHHGPTDVGVPSMFVEVGSGEAQWKDPAAARAVARAILELRGVDPDAPRENGVRRHLVGFGGGHYAPRFERVVGETDWAVGHVAADWSLEELGEPRENAAVVDRAFVQSDAEYALLEAERPELRAVVGDLGYRVVGETWVRETAGVPLGLVERLETAIGSVEDGLRFGERARGGDGPDATAEGPAVTGDGSFDVVEFDPDLLAEASGVERRAARTAVAEHAVAFDTADNGSLVVGPVAVDTPDAADAIVDGLAAVLREKYDEVDRAGEELVARIEAFDPERAREAGVPEGPKFGRLSAGEPVDVDGETVTPAEVTRERERSFKI